MFIPDLDHEAAPEDCSPNDGYGAARVTPGPRHERAQLLIADDAPTRLGVRIALDSLGLVCAEAETADQAVAEAELNQPDVCLVGLGIPGGAISAARRISAVVPTARIIVLAASEDPEDLLGCIRAGAIGYVPRGTDQAALVRIVKCVLAGQAAIPRSMVMVLVRELREPRSGDEVLTAREAQVLAMLKRGDSTVVVAQRLAISPVTVRRHVSPLVRKLGSKNREALVQGAGKGAEQARQVGQRTLSVTERLNVTERLSIAERLSVTERRKSTV
jgi:DNA-binding NarL/FixJ family response regulator